MRTLIFGLVGAILVASAAAADSPRQTLKFNDDWKFKLGDTTEASHTDFKDADWRTRAQCRTIIRSKGRRAPIRRRWKARSIANHLPAPAADI